MVKKINIEDLYVEDIVKGFAKNINALCLEENNITKISFPIEFGKGYLKATQFASGLGIIEASYFLKNDLIVEMDKEKINPLKFLFNLGESFYQKFDEETEFEEIKKFSGAIVGSSVNNTTSFKIPKEKEVYIFSVELNRNLFEHKIKSFRFNLDEDLIALLKDVKAINPFFYNYLFGVEVFDAIKKITTTQRKGFTGSLYKEGITYTILADTLETYLGKRDHRFLNKDLTEKEISKVISISDFIDKNLENLPTIDLIAKENSISETKIQKFFNAYYNCSVNDFIKNKRLTKARDLLEKSDFSIAEISQQIGVKSNSYFTKIFRERYGVNPSEYKNSRLKNIRFY